MSIPSLQVGVLIILAFLAFGMQLFALVDAVRTRSDAFVAAGKLTKPKWLAILGVAAAFGFIALPIAGGGLTSSIGFLSIIAVVAATVYLVDVRPAVKQIQGGGGTGPYGGW